MTLHIIARVYEAISTISTIHTCKSSRGLNIFATDELDTIWHLSQLDKSTHHIIWIYLERDPLLRRRSFCPSECSPIKTKGTPLLYHVLVECRYWKAQQSSPLTLFHFFWRLRVIMIIIIWKVRWINMVWQRSLVLQQIPSKRSWRSEERE